MSIAALDIAEEASITANSFSEIFSLLIVMHSPKNKINNTVKIIASHKKVN